MSKPSDPNCELLLELSLGKERWKAFRAKGGTIGDQTSVMDNYVDLMDMFEVMNHGIGKLLFISIFGLEPGAYARIVRQCKAYNLLKKK